MTERRFPVSGEIDLATSTELQERLLVLVSLTTDDLVLDCVDLTFIDSVGISVFVYTQRLLEVQGRTLRVVNLNGTARKPFDILGLTEMLEMPEPEPA